MTTGSKTLREDVVMTEAAKTTFERFDRLSIENNRHLAHRRALQLARRRGGSPIEITAADVRDAWEWTIGRKTGSRMAPFMWSIMYLGVSFGLGLASGGLISFMLGSASQVWASLLMAGGAAVGIVAYGMTVLWLLRRRALRGSDSE